MLEDLKGGQIYSAWWRVLLGVAPELEAESDVQFPLACEYGFSIPQRGKLLANWPYVFLNHVVSYLMSAGGYGPYPILPCESVDDGEQV